MNGSARIYHKSCGRFITSNMSFLLKLCIGRYCNFNEHVLQVIYMEQGVISSMLHKEKYTIGRNYTQFDRTLRYVIYTYNYLYLYIYTTYTNLR